VAHLTREGSKGEKRKEEDVDAGVTKKMNKSANG